jgi:uncharacterized damage-inducible protein DinB
MTIAETLLQDFDHEIKGTRRTLALIPDSPDFKPHEKSMKMGRLAAHVSTLPRLATLILTTDVIEAPNAQWPPHLEFVSTAKLLEDFDRLAAEARAALAAATDDQLSSHWKFLWDGKVGMEGPRSVIYRTAFFNHLIHHRAQLGVYLRLNDIPIPGLYGPSADGW